ncbi:LysE family transporter [Geodermatophilus sp. DSM 44513]|uniref:LysE family translocator n=1 Tax=Geodermatophilus sp. DSM 44513 TaxID=1528104 RepID=UPI00127E0A42|nr:LysE family transporter [Geodermatophilus sp. DSM 44513]WNV74285.1 LysE family transporter [Geodermatophilus sp. DSM 44513]
MPESLAEQAAAGGSIGSLLLASLAVMGSPGPTTMSLVATGSAFGMRRCLPYLTGVVLGTTAVLVAVATGLTAALLAVPAIGSVLTVGAVVYILWLAFHIATAAPLSEQPAAASLPSLTGGVFLGLANPKAWLAIAAVFASARSTPDAGADAAAKLLLLTAMIVAIHLGWLLIGASITPVLRGGRWSRVINVTLAAALVVATVLAVLP